VAVAAVVLGMRLELVVGGLVAAVEAAVLLLELIQYPVLVV
jgi:hypothetical protein